MNTESSANNKAKLAAWVVIIAAVVLLYVFFNGRAGGNSASDTASTMGSPTSSQTNEKAATSGNMHGHSAGMRFKDGTYTASSTYSTPGGQENIDVSITLTDNRVTDSSVQQIPSDPEAEQYQVSFRENYKPLVIGKDITEINLTRVSGSSLTSRGFNDALEQIKNQAHHHDS